MNIKNIKISKQLEKKTKTHSLKDYKTIVKIKSISYLDQIAPPLLLSIIIYYEMKHQKKTKTNIY
jgi:hypothetical protein